MSALKRADLARGAVDRALTAEKFEFQSIGVHRRAIDGDKGATGTTRTGMQKPADDFLADPRRTGDQHTAAGRRHPVDLLA